MKHFWKMVRAFLLEAVYLLIYILLAPWSLVLAPVLGFWGIIYLTQLSIYRDLNEDFRIEEQFYKLEGDPWRVSAIDILPEEGPNE